MTSKELTAINEAEEARHTQREESMEEQTYYTDDVHNAWIPRTASYVLSDLRSKGLIVEGKVPDEKIVSELDQLIGSMFECHHPGSQKSMNRLAQVVDYIDETDITAEQLSEITGISPADAAVIAGGDVFNEGPKRFSHSFLAVIAADLERYKLDNGFYG